MDHNETLAYEETATEADQETQVAAKTYTQDEVDNMMARMRGSIERKMSKQFEDLGDIEELRQLKATAEQQRVEQQLKRGEFEKTLQEKMAAKDQEIQKRDAIIQDYRLNTPLLNAAAKHKAVNPEQVQALLRNSVRLNEEGNAEVLDSTGAVRYDDRGNPITIDSFVEEWLKSNPHFLSPGPSTTNARSSIAASTKGAFDLNDLDLTKPEHRKMYQEARSKGLI